jgi:hypothetical protein
MNNQNKTSQTISTNNPIIRWVQPSLAACFIACGAGANPANPAIKTLNKEMMTHGT